MTFKVKKQVVLVLLVLFTSLSVVYAEAPFDSSAIIDDFKANADQIVSGKVVKVELYPKDRYTKVERNFLYYPYYCSRVVVDYEGSYGQVYRANVAMNYIEVDGRWSLDQAVQESGTPVTLVQGPTKPLPEPPTAPDKASVIKLFDNYEPIGGTSDTFKNEVLSLSEPTFSRRGWDYQFGIYTYAGRMRYTRIGPREGLIAVFRRKEVYECDFKVIMTYEYATQKWTNKIQLDSDNVKRIK
jgi:hypothetical protein